jgi:hypothetical protein
MDREIKYPIEKYTRNILVHCGQEIVYLIMIGYGNMVWSYALNIPEGITRYINVSKLLWI